MIIPIIMAAVAISFFVIVVSSVISKKRKIEKMIFSNFEQAKEMLKNNQNAEEKKCEYCGAVLNDDDKKCSNCGAIIKK